RAETLLAHNSSFKPVDLKHRLFTRAPNSNLRDRLLALSPSPGMAETAGATRHARLREASFDASPVAQISIDRRGFLVQANDRARRMFGLAPADLGRVLQDLEISYRPIELRSHIEEAQGSRSAVVIKDVEWRGAGGETRHLEVQVTPLLDTNSTLGTSI